jgi:hypothetical protein
MVYVEAYSLLPPSAFLAGLRPAAPALGRTRIWHCIQRRARHRHGSSSEADQSDHQPPSPNRYAAVSRATLIAAVKSP